MNLEELLRAKREKILRVCAKYGARNVRIFDSVARGAADEQSDVDLVVDFEPVRAKMEGRWRRGQPLPLPPGEGRHEGPAVCRDIPGFCKSSTLEEIRQHGYVLTQGRYVGRPEQDKHDALFESEIAWACHNDTTGNPRGAGVLCCSCTSLESGEPKLVLLCLPSN
jgi:type I restriction-modification system DNA methylase subunit